MPFLRASSQLALNARTLRAPAQLRRGLASEGAPRSRGINTNSPKFIFLGWTALVFVAGFGYYTVKTRNTAKAQEFLRRSRLEDASTEEEKEQILAESKNLRSQRQSESRVPPTMGLACA